MAKKTYPTIHHDQLSQNDEGHSGLPLRSDGSLRESSDAVPPIVKKRGMPVNEPQK